MQKWIVSRSLGKQLIYHVQARTEDQLSSFAILAGDNAVLTRQKSADGKNDVFTAMSDQGHATMNVVGKIVYKGDWKGIP